LVAWLLALSAAALSTGCVTMMQDESDGTWIRVPAGGTLTLHRDITIPIARTRVFLVNGKARRSGASYNTSCELEVRTIDRDRARSIAAASIRIDRVDPYWTEFARRADESASQLRPASQDGGDGNQMIRSGYRFTLSGEDPEVKRLTCLGVLDDPAFAYPPTLAEIRAALGSLATLELNLR
jgi:hypothetical protein